MGRGKSNVNDTFITQKEVSEDIDKSIKNKPHPTPNKRPKQNPPPAMKPSPAIVYNRTTPENKANPFTSHFKAI